MHSLPPNSAAPDNFSERLRIWRVSRNFTQAQAAQHLDIDRSYLSQVERGRQPGNALRTRFLLVEQTTIVRISNGSGPQVSFKKLPLLSWSKASQIQFLGRQPLEYDESIPTDLSDERAFAVRLRGDAMEPKISDQDVANLSPSDPAFNGEAVLANLKNEGLVCRLIHLQQEGSVIKLSSYNPAYPALEYRREEFFWIVPIVSIIRSLRFR